MKYDFWDLFQNNLRQQSGGGSDGQLSINETK